MKHTFIAISFVLLLNITFGQTLFTFGNKPVNKQQFLNAFNKNPPKKEDRRKALDEYLGLYINYKLKVQAGYDDQLDKQPSIEQESKNFRKQIAENVINEEVGIKELTKEALLRSQKDIHAAQVFVEINKEMDSAKALKKINEAYAALQSGKSFADVAVSFSTDEAVKKSKGDLGYITAFTLAYNFESEIYNLKQGTYSKPYKSAIGYHIFKNISERSAVGKRKIAHILIATPPGYTHDQKKQYASLADSIYQLLKSGTSFDKMALEFSNDYKTSNIGGVLNDISVGQYDTDFETKVFGLKSINEITPPFESDYGYHIIKLIEKKEVAKDVNDAATIAAMKMQVEKDERLRSAKKKQLVKWLSISKYTPYPYDHIAFKAYTDSNLEGKITNGIKNITDTTVLFTFEKRKVHAADWAVYATKNITQTMQDYSAMLKQFTEHTCTQYYTDFLELYSQPMKDQCKEFDEANILFAAMDKHVWSKASEDIVGLKNYYSQHKDKYVWNASVNAVIVSAKTKALADELIGKIKQNPDDWRTTSSNYGADVNADSGRYEITQLPIKSAIENKVGFVSVPEKNSSDDAFTFVYVLKSHTSNETRTFDEAKGMVINDYQQVLEAQWLTTLKKKYPIKVNDAVWKTIQ